MNDKTMNIVKEHARRMRIMIVDSNKENLTEYKRFLEPLFVEVNTQHEAKQAYKKWEEDTDRYDIIILSLDGDNGENLELFRSIRKKSYEQKIIIALKSGNYNELKGVICRGVDGIITSPHDEIALMAIFHRLLREISDRKLLYSYVTQLSIMAKDNLELRTHAFGQELVDIPLTSASLVDKYAIRTSFKTDDTAMAIRNMDVFSMERIDTFREKIQGYQQRLGELDITDAVETKGRIITVVDGLLKMIDIINSLGLFPVTVQAAFHMSEFLKECEASVFENQEKKMVILDILIALFDDLDKWIDTVFIKQNFEYINYFDASFANTCLELEKAFVSDLSGTEESEDVLEFF